MDIIEKIGAVELRPTEGGISFGWGLVLLTLTGAACLESEVDGLRADSFSDWEDCGYPSLEECAEARYLRIVSLAAEHEQPWR